MTIIVSSAGSNTAIGIIKAIRLAGINCRIIATDVNPAHLCAGALLADVFYQLPYVYDKESYTAALLSIIKKEKIDCFIPVHDEEISLAAQLKSSYAGVCAWAVNNEEIVELCNNKVMANNKARELNIPIPEYFAQHTDIPPYKFPVMLKPVAGVSSRGIFKADNSRQIQEYLSKAGNIKYFIQQYISIEAEYTIDTYSCYEQKEMYGAVVRQRLETKDGIATKAVTVNNPELIGMAKKFLDAIQYQGMANLQFIKNGEHYYFIEINPRFSGAGILSVAAGLNGPLLTLQNLMGQKLPPFSSIDLKYDYYMTRYWQESFAYAESNNN